ncbi:hypothetical protein [uncultured Methanobrevibacter sp.]|uniref:hypothetical protein n=1 Tax=uncultured Methanobrevibacter sp. TaxID=253161 RepID=UPI0025E74FEC|nr:hypothetical protein [uncultured Methanobrevibacter sp.]
MFLQETYELEDYHLYDDATTDKSSNYSPNRLNGGVTGALTYDNTNQAYNIKINEGKTASASNAGYFLVNLPVTSNNCLFSAKIKGSALEGDFSTADFGLAKWNTSNNLAGMHYVRGEATTKRYSESNSSGNTHKINQNSNPTITRDTWYMFSLEINGTSMIFKLYDSTGETQLYTHTATCSTNILDGNLSIVCGWGKQQLFVKDIKVKAL